MEETLNKLLEELDKTIFYIEFKKEYLKEKGIRDKRIKKDLKKLKKINKKLELMSFGKDICCLVDTGIRVDDDFDIN